MCDMTPLYVWHDSFICVTWLVHLCDMTHSSVRRNVTHSNMWHDSFRCVTWLLYMCDMTRSYVWHDLFICATYRDSPVTQAQAFVHVECSQKVKARKMFAALWVMSHVWMSHVTRMHKSVSQVARTNESHHTFIWDMSHVWVRRDKYFKVLSPASRLSHMTWVMSQIQVSHVTHTHESCQTYEWVMLHMWVRRGHFF